MRHRQREGDDVDEVTYSLVAFPAKDNYVSAAADSLAGIAAARAVGARRWLPQGFQAPPLSSGWQHCQPAHSPAPHHALFLPFTLGGPPVPLGLDQEGWCAVVYACGLLVVQVEASVQQPLVQSRNPVARSPKVPPTPQSQIHARSTPTHKWLTVVDAAAYVPTHPLNLTEVKPDFVPISFYKMLGSPTGGGTRWGGGRAGSAALCAVSGRASLAMSWAGVVASACSSTFSCQQRSSPTALGPAKH